MSSYKNVYMYELATEYDTNLTVPFLSTMTFRIYSTVDQVSDEMASLNKPFIAVLVPGDGFHRGFT